MNMRKISLALPFALIGAAAAGCGVDGAPNDPESSETSVTTDPIGSTVTEQPLVAHGGSGGSFNGHVTPAAVIYGLQVNSGQFVDHVTFFYYQPTRADNLYAGEPLFSVGFGGGGGSANPSFVCPANQSIVGIRGASGQFVDRIGVECSDVTNPDPFNAANGQSPLWGGGGGTFFDDRCGVGRLVDSFNVRSASLLDNLQAICINAQ
jgi:hypothetical protein